MYWCISMECVLKCNKLGCAALWRMCWDCSAHGTTCLWKKEKNRHNSRKYLASGYTNNVCALDFFSLSSFFSFCGLCCAFGSSPCRRYVYCCVCTVPEWRAQYFNVCSSSLAFDVDKDDHTTTTLVIKWPLCATIGFAHHNSDRARRKIENGKKKTRKTNIVCVCVCLRFKCRTGIRTIEERKKGNPKWVTKINKCVYIDERTNGMSMR